MHVLAGREGRVAFLVLRAAPLSGRRKGAGKKKKGEVSNVHGTLTNKCPAGSPRLRGKGKKEGAKLGTDVTDGGESGGFLARSLPVQKREISSLPHHPGKGGSSLAVSNADKERQERGKETNGR